jgi:hypothetical protein
LQTDAFCQVELDTGGSASSTPSATYWRIVWQNYSQANYPSVNTVKMMASATGENLCVNGTALASSFLDPYVPDRAFDTFASSEWIANGTTYEWLGYQFPAAVSVGALTIRSGSTVDSAPQRFLVQYSNDKNVWKTTATVETTWTANTEKTFTL